MIEKELINLLLDKDFYEKNKSRVSKSMFTNGTGNLYETIAKAHEQSDGNLTIDEIETLHTQVYNPALTRAAKENFKNLLDEIKKEKPNKEIANTILESLYKLRLNSSFESLSKTIYDSQKEVLPFTCKILYFEFIK